MSRKRFIERVIPTVVCLVIALAVGSPVMAWGPFTHGVIAGAAAEMPGMPPTVTGYDYMRQASAPKALEYTNLSYAEFSYDFSQAIDDLARSDGDKTQALAWGSFQTAERTGDGLLFHEMSQNVYQRWLHEILCDALLFSWVESPWRNLVGDVGVAVRPKLVSEASQVYTARFGGMPFSGLEAVTMAHFQALVMVGEMAVIQNPLVQGEGVNQIDLNLWHQAMEQSVADVAAYAMNGTRSRFDSNWLVGDAEDYGSQLLGKLGSILVSTGDATISVSRQDGVWSYRFELTTARVNEITVTFLGNISRSLDEHPIVRQLALSLHQIMTARRIDGPNPGPGNNDFGILSSAE